jgi:hypothetical protein
MPYSLVKRVTIKERTLQMQKIRYLELLQLGKFFTKSMNGNQEKLFFVDLDGTFAKNDLFQELLARQFCQKPVITIIVFLKGGVLALKHFVFKNYIFSPRQVIVNKSVLELIQHKKDIGYKIYLATASPQVYADFIFKTWTVFDAGFGSNKKVNLKAKAKLDLIVTVASGNTFEYIGDSKADEIIFSKCQIYYKVIDNQVYERTS